MNYYMGIDGGGTKTVCVLSSDDGTIIGKASAGPSNYHTVGIEQTRAAIEKCISEAINQSQQQINEIRGITLGMAGVDRPEGRTLMNRILDSLPLVFRARQVDNDAVVALAGATVARPGVVIICGTGSIAFGLNKAGLRQRAGGWGHILGDEGSGYDIGRQAMVAALRDADGRGAHTLLKPLIVEQLGLPTIEALVSYVYTGDMPRHAIAGLTPLVHQAAEQGDYVARGILNRAGSELAECGLAVVRRLGMERDHFEIALVGGVLSSATLISETISRLTREAAPYSEVIRPRFEPVVGALLLALKAGPNGLNEQMVQNIARSFPRG